MKSFSNNLRLNKPCLAIEPDYTAMPKAIESFITFKDNLSSALEEHLATLNKIENLHDSELSCAQEQIQWLHDQHALANLEHEKERATAKAAQSQIAHLELAQKSTLADLESAWQTQLEMQDSLIAQQKEIESLRKKLYAQRKEIKSLHQKLNTPKGA